MQQLLQLLLILQILGLQASADDFHEVVHNTGCSDFDKEDMTGSDGDVMYYADFDQKKVVYTLPKFGDPIVCPGYYEQAVGDHAVCKNNLQTLRRAVKDPPHLDPPGAPLLFPKDHLRPSQPNILLCQASGFYPAPVNFSWTRDGLPVASSSVSQAYPQSDGSFSQVSTLQVLPKDGQVFSCSLEHPALRGEKRSRLWTVEFPRASVAPSVFCGVGLTVAVVGVAVGTFFLVKGNECR